MIDFLLLNGAPIDACDGMDRTPVFVASAIGRNDIVEFLAEKGKEGNVLFNNALNTFYFTPRPVL